MRNSEPFAVGIADIMDVEWIALFQVEMALETEGLRLDPSVVQQGVRRLLEAAQTEFYVAARDWEGKPIGCLMVLKEWSDWRNAEVWWIHSVYVRPAYRRRGVFRRMFGFVEGLALAEEAVGLRLYVERENERARMVYAKLGMNNEHYELFEKLFYCHGGQGSDE
jgi:GNAT superfamily N-acetyltransferase